jgi:beta-glucanase (GH16 family)
VALASAKPQAHHAQASIATTVSKPVKSSGDYVVVLTVRSRKQAEDVTVYLSGATKRQIRASSHTPTALDYHVTVSKPVKLTARAVSERGVRLEMTLKRQSTRKTSGDSTPPTPAPAPAPSPPASSSSQYPNPYTNLVWSDDFSGPAGSAPSNANWNVDGGTGQCGDAINSNTGSPANVQLDGNNQLAITAQKNGSSYTSAEIETNPITSFPYGAVEANMKLPAGQGLCPAFWLEGDSTSASPCSWPGCGEIDVVEAPSFGPVPTYAIFTLHGPWSQPDPTGNYQDFETNTSALGDLSAGFHTYGIVWSPNSITWTIDGVAYAQATPSNLQASGAQWVFNNNRPYSIILDLAVGGWPCDSSGNPVPPPNPCPGASFPAQMLVNWVHVYN